MIGVLGRLLAVTVLLLTFVRAAEAQTISEFPLSDYPGTNLIAAGPDGALWFHDSWDRLARITTTGEVSRSRLPMKWNHWVHAMTAGPDGAIWFTFATSPPQRPSWSEHIGRITAAGEFSEFLVPRATDGLLGLTTGPDGALWFTESRAKKIWRATTTGSLNEFPMPNMASDGFPDRITAGPDGALWFTEIYSDRIGRITTDGVITELPFPSALEEQHQYYPGITAGPNCSLWLTDPFGELIRGITTAGAVTEFKMPSPNGVPWRIAPWEITTGPDGALWFTELLANKFGRMTTTGEFSEFTLPTTKYSLDSITTGPNGAIWFAGSDHKASRNNNGSEIGRITVAQNQKGDSVQSALNCPEPREASDKVRVRPPWPLSILLLILIIGIFGLHPARRPVRQS